MVIGVPTIKRERDSYLMQTLESLLDNLSFDERDDVLIVVFIAEVFFQSQPLCKQLNIHLGSDFKSVVFRPKTQLT